MSARARNLNFLKRCGYQPFYQIRDGEVIIICRAEQGVPALKLSLTCSLADGFGKSLADDYFLIESAHILNLKTKEESSFEAKGTVASYKGIYYLNPGKELASGILAIVDQAGGYRELWRLSQAILQRGKDYIDKASATEIFSNISSIQTKGGKIIHPLVFTGSPRRVSFISRDMLEFCLALELNLKRESSQFLKQHINRHTLDFLDIDPSFFEAFGPIAEKKKQKLQQQRYEEAARLRDLEIAFRVEYISKAWPNLSQEDVQRFLTQKIQVLNL